MSSLTTHGGGQPSGRCVRNRKAGRLLEPDLSGAPTEVESAAITFLVRGTTGAIAGVTETEDSLPDPRSVDFNLAMPGKHVQAARKYNGYLAHAMVIDEEPGAASGPAHALISSLRVAYADAGAIR